MDSAHLLREALSQSWDAVLSGYRMAGLSGAEVLRIVRSSRDDEDLTRLGFLLGRSVAKKKATGEGHEALQLAQISIDKAAVLIHWADLDGRLLYVNGAACRRLRHFEDELLGMTVFDIDPGQRAQTGRGGEAGTPGPTAVGAEDGDGGATGGRYRPRLQQPTHGDHRHQLSGPGYDGSR